MLQLLDAFKLKCADSVQIKQVPSQPGAFHTTFHFPKAVLLEMFVSYSTMKETIPSNCNFVNILMWKKKIIKIQFKHKSTAAEEIIHRTACIEYGWINTWQGIAAMKDFNRITGRLQAIC